jgi:small GTP-binding protein
MSDPYKVVLLGESGVGKTCIIAQFTNGVFDPDTVTSLTAQFIRKTISFEDNKSITFDIWDTAGQEKYRSMAKIFYKDAKAVILVYDITNKKSFEEMRDFWYEQVKQNGDSDVIIAIAGNKRDLYEEKQVSDEEGEEFAKKVKGIFASTSAKNDSGIQALFDNIGQKIIDPNFNFAANEEKKKEEYKKMKQKEAKQNKQNNQNANNAVASKGVKLKSGNDKQEKKKKCC